ncbi:MAG: ferrous iron transport protein A [Bacteroidetes bacterium]|jgi:ferrous iron transport protein A|nr:ferrous iron transport protein A [Bacteroidota bacterium]
MTEPLDNLASLKPGEKAVIISFLDEDLSLKLLEMGCTPGEEVEVEKIAPFGDPIAINISGYVLSLRRAEASTVQIRKIVLDN